MSIDFGALAGAVEKDLSAVGAQLHASATADLDEFRSQLPAITAAAHQHVDSMAAAMLSWGEKVLADVRGAFGLPDPATGQPTASPAPVAPAAPEVPQVAAPAPQPTTDSAASSTSSPNASTEGSATAAETPASAE